MKAVEGTRDMIPGSGRAVYSRLNAPGKSRHPDPGAALIGLVVQIVVEVLLQEN